LYNPNLTDHDCKLELAIGYSDRVIRLYKWKLEETDGEYNGAMIQLNKWQLAGQVGWKGNLYVNKKIKLLSFVGAFSLV